MHVAGCQKRGFLVWIPKLSGGIVKGAKEQARLFTAGLRLPHECIGYQVCTLMLSILGGPKTRPPHTDQDPGSGDHPAGTPDCWKP